MKWLLALWIMAIVMLAGTYSNIIDLQKTVNQQVMYIAELTTEIVELETKEDIWYKGQIERWIPPYDGAEVPEKYLGQVSYTESAVNEYKGVAKQ